MFGSNNNNQNQNQNNSTPTFSFGASNTNNNASASGQTTGFGSTAGGSLFGQTANTAGTGATTGFGATGFGQANAAGTGSTTGFGSTGFGQANSAATNTTGGATTGFGSTGSSLFGQQSSTAAPAAGTTTGFGATSTGGTTFGQANTNTSTGAGFSLSSAPKPAAGGFGFTASSTPASGTANTAAAGTNTGFSFGGASNSALGGAATSQPASASSFGSTSTAPAASGFNFGNASTASSAPASGSLFSGFGNKSAAASSAAPAASGATGFAFNLGSSSQAKPGLGLASVPGTTPAGGLGFGSSLTGTSISNPPAVLTTTPLSSTPSVPSISGSVQSTIPSLLHKKDMQDILSEWTNEVKNLTDDFLTQAKEVSKWDQIVRENTKTINQLISASKECSSFQNNIDSNIEYVLTQQEELNKILDEYETKIDEKIQAHQLKQQQEGSSHGSADIYRENTMKTANSLAQDLQTVEKQLEDIVKETKAYSDQESSQMPDSVNQILGILNAHLLALEQLNSNSHELDTKLSDLIQNNAQSQPFVHGHSGNTSNPNLSSGVFPSASLNNNPHPRSTIQRNFYQAQESLNSQNSFFGGSR